MEKMNIEKKDFIWIADGFVLPSACDDMINLYKEQEKMKRTMDRWTSEGAGALAKKDEACGITTDVLTDPSWQRAVQPFVLNLNTVVMQYINSYGIEFPHNHKPFYDLIKIQKTLPGGGYHVFHYEKSWTYSTASRILAWTLYLNDVEEGGETEFLYQQIRVKPKKGRFCLWPAGFPYTHRGNPPLSGEKYIATSWVRMPYLEDLSL